MIRINDWELVTLDEEECDVDDLFRLHTGEFVYLQGGRPPHNPSSNGFVHVTSQPGERGTSSEYYAKVISCKWIYKGDKNDPFDR